jgi:glycosyl transferase family 25
MGLPTEVDAARGRVFVINLARAAERRAFILKELGRAGFSPSDIEMMRAVDGRDLTPDLLHRRGASLFANWRLPSSPVVPFARDLKWGEVACSLSHIEAWRQIAASAEPYGMVLEDDVEFLADARTIRRELWLLSSLVPGWHLCYVGRGPVTPLFFPAEQPETRVAPHLVVPNFRYGAYAYAVSRAGAIELLEARLERAIVPVDDFLPALYTPHPRHDVRRAFGRGDRLRAFAIDPRLAHQPGVHPSTIESSETVVDGTSRTACR